MNSLKIEATEDSPFVDFDLNARKLLISGESRPENASKFYAPVIEWIGGIAGEVTSDKEAITVVFKLDYFNSISAKYIMDIILVFKKYIDNGSKINIQWHYDKRDDDMLDAGKEYAEAAGLKFEFIEF